MLESDSYLKGLIHTVTELAKADQSNDLIDLLLNSEVKIKQTHYDGWNGGTYGYTIFIETDVSAFVNIRGKIEIIESEFLDKVGLATRHLEDESVHTVKIIPRTYTVSSLTPNPHRPFSVTEQNRRNDLISYLDTCSEDELIEDVLLSLFRQLGFHRITPSGHKDKALEYGKDIWMKFTLPTQHLLYFGIQVKKGKLDASGVSKNGSANIAEVHNQTMMMLGHEIFDSEIGKKVLVDHAFIVAGGEVTKSAKNWIGGKLDASKRSQILFMDRDDILNLYVVTNLPLPIKAIKKEQASDELPF